MKAVALFLALAVGPASFAQSVQSDSDTTSKQRKSNKHEKSTAADLGGGAGDIAGGAAKGAGNAAKGVGKGVADAATLHPLNAAGDIGTGAVKAGKDVTVGSAKGVGKVGKGIGHAFKKIL
jgi:hypothetical protein